MNDAAAAPDRPDQVTIALDRVFAVFLLGAGFSIVVEQSMAVLAVLIWVTASILRRERPWLPLFWPSVVFVGASLAACVFAADPSLAFGQLRSDWVPFALFLVVANLPPSPRRVGRRVAVMTATGGLMVIAGLVQTVVHGSSFRIYGTLGHYMTYSGVLVLLGLPLLATLLFRAKGRLGRGEIARVVVLLGMGVALVLTQTRGAWLAVFAGVAVLVALWRARFLAALPVLAVVAFLLAPPAARARLADLTDWSDITATERVYMWRASANMLRDHPLTGVGIDNFRNAIFDYRLPDDPWILGRPLSHAHSNGFMLAAERGLWGLGAWIVFWLAWVVVIVRIWRALPPDDPRARAGVAGSVAAVIAFHVAGLTEYTWGDTEVAYLAAFVWGAGLAYRRDATLTE